MTFFFFWPAITDRLLPIAGTRGSLEGWSRKEGFVLPVDCCLGQHPSAKAFCPGRDSWSQAAASFVGILRTISPCLPQRSECRSARNLLPTSRVSSLQMLPLAYPVWGLTISCNYHLCDVLVSPFSVFNKCLTNFLH